MDKDFFYDGDIKFYKPFCSPQEKPYVEAIQKAFPDYTMESGPYCPGKAWHLTYRIVKDGKYKVVHVRDIDYVVSTDEDKMVNVVVTAPKDTDAVAKKLEEAGFFVTRVHTKLGLVTGSIDEDKIESLKALEGVVDARKERGTSRIQ